MALPLCILITFLVCSLFPYSSVARNSDMPHNLVRSSCIHANYPDLCLRTLTAYVGPAKTPNDVAKAAVSVSLSRARKVSEYLTNLAHIRNGRSGREQGALSDCVDQLTDSVDQLKKSLSELQHLRSRTFRWQMSNAETWVSAALTYEDTCLDGFQKVDGKIKMDVKRQITNLAKVTSNALYLITRLDESRGKGS
ncbi:Pectinesterase inhibitor domain [Macleaya cordata]|uniref:Pectinesterase inhibitor domain n=1 Tax=Macleaya cordata TaxID=56857 RepID=A0A200QPJ0_MACCD|nr:Pectinesterase inhibitor domain [Macleaya cordata]